MSVAACLTDTKDLARNPAVAVKDTQHTEIDHFYNKQSFFGVPSHHLSSFLLSLYLTCLSVALPSPLSYTFLISAFSVNKDAISIWLLLPKTLSLPLICLSIPPRCSAPLSIIHAVHVSRSVSHFLPSICLTLSLSLSPQPTASLSLGRGEQCRPTWGPAQSQPRRQGAPENTHNSMFQTGLRDKGKPHTWLTMWVSLGSFVEAEGSNWHQNPPLRVCIYVCENECVMSPSQPSGEGPP